MDNNNKNKCDIFISWSYNRFSQLFAEKLKQFICDIYSIQTEKVFVSSQNLHGSDWVNKIQEFASSCKIGISCMTSSTKKNEWLIYELGAMSHIKEVILVAIDFPRYELTADFYSRYTCKSGVHDNKQLEIEDFIKLLLEIFQELSEFKVFQSITKRTKEQCLAAFEEYSKTTDFKKDVDELLDLYKRFSARCLFFISRPMRDYSGSDALTTLLKELFPYANDPNEVEKEVYYSTNANKLEAEEAHFLGKERLENISNSGTFVLIWPKMDSQATSSSCLIELGAALSLNKRILIFSEEDAILPSFFLKIDENEKKELVHEYKGNEGLKRLLEKHIKKELEEKKKRELEEKKKRELEEKEKKRTGRKKTKK